MFKILLLVMATGGQATIVAGPNALSFTTKEACDAKIASEVEAAQLIIDSDLRIEKGALTIRGGRCFSEDEINKLRGGQSANEGNLYVSVIEK